MKNSIPKPIIDYTNQIGFALKEQVTNPQDRVYLLKSWVDRPGSIPALQRVLLPLSQDQKQAVTSLIQNLNNEYFKLSEDKSQGKLITAMQVEVVKALRDCIAPKNPMGVNLDHIPLTPLKASELTALANQLQTTDISALANELQSLLPELKHGLAEPTSSLPENTHPSQTKPTERKR